MDFLIDPLFYNWLILGAILLIIEVSSFTLLFLWLSASAFAMAGVSYFIPTMSASTQLVMFSVLSVLSVVVWHTLFKKTQDSIGDAKMNNRAERYVGRTATLVEAVENGRGKIQIEDSFWRVSCEHDLPAGTQVQILGTEGVLLNVTEHIK